MNLAYLGDALDHWKGSLFDFLKSEGLLHDFAVDPMATDGDKWRADDYALFARLLHVTKSQIVHHESALAERATYFAEITHRGDLFLDPDTGIHTGHGSPISKYVKPRELAKLLAVDARVVAVYQHIRAKKTCVRVDGCLRAIAAVVDRVGWCSYESGTVAMLFLSRDVARTAAIAKAFGRLLGKQAASRVRSGVNELRAAQQRVAELTRSALARRSGNEAAGPGRVDIARAANQRIWDFVHQPANVSLRAGTGYYSTPFRGRLFGEVKAAEVAKQLTTRGVDVLWLGANPCVPTSLDNIINAPADSGDYILENGRAITDTVEVWWLSGTLAPGTERAARTWRW